MKKIKNILVIFLCLIAVFLMFEILFFCQKKGLISEAKFSEMDPKIKISFQGNTIIADSNDSFRIDGSTLTILKGGKYRLSGKLDNGQIIVAADEDEEVILKLNDVNVHCEDSAALWIQSAAKVTLKLSEGSENYFSDGANYTDLPDGIKAPTACIYSRCDLKIKGDGALILLGNHKNGLTCVDDIKIKAGKINIAAINTAIKCKDDITMEGGSLYLTSGKDGIYCEETVDLSAGDITIDAGRYGIFAFLEIKKTEDVILNIINAKSALASHGK